MIFRQRELRRQWNENAYTYISHLEIHLEQVF